MASRHETESKSGSRIIRGAEAAEEAAGDLASVVPIADSLDGARTSTDDGSVEGTTMKGRELTVEQKLAEALKKIALVEERAEEEKLVLKQRAEAAEERAEAAEEEKQRAEEEKQRAEEEKLVLKQRAEEEKQRAEEEKQRAEAAEEEKLVLKQRAEEEKQRVDGLEQAITLRVIKASTSNKEKRKNEWTCARGGSLAHTNPPKEGECAVRDLFHSDPIEPAVKSILDTVTAKHWKPLLAKKAKLKNILQRSTKEDQFQEFLQGDLLANRTVAEKLTASEANKLKYMKSIAAPEHLHGQPELLSRLCGGLLGIVYDASRGSHIPLDTHGANYLNPCPADFWKPQPTEVKTLSKLKPDISIFPLHEGIMFAKDVKNYRAQAPLSVVSFIEIKPPKIHSTKTEDPESDVKSQAFQYLRSILHCQSDRKFAVGFFVYNAQLWGMRVDIREDGRLDTQVSKPMDLFDETCEAARVIALASYFPEKLGREGTTKKVEGIQHFTRILGTGASGAAFAGLRGDGVGEVKAAEVADVKAAEVAEEVVVKLFADEYDFQNERKALELIAYHLPDSSTSIPRVLDVDPEPTYTLEMMDGQCEAKGALLMVPCGVPVNAFRADPLKVYASPFSVTSFVDDLFVIHRAGLVHRDLRPSNLIVNPANGQLVLIDWACSIDTGGEGSSMQAPFAGSTDFCSWEAFNFLHKKGGPGFAWSYKEDLIGLVHSAFALTENHGTELRWIKVNAAMKTGLVDKTYESGHQRKTQDYFKNNMPKDLTDLVSDINDSKFGKEIYDKVKTTLEDTFRKIRARMKFSE